MRVEDWVGDLDRIPQKRYVVTINVHEDGFLSVHDYEEFDSIKEARAFGDEYCSQVDDEIGYDVFDRIQGTYVIL